MNSAQTLVDPAASSPAEPAGLMAAPLRLITVGMLALISLLAFEHLAVATVMPVVARALNGPQWYTAAFGVAIASSIVGMVWGGRWSDRDGPAPPVWAGVAAFVLGVLTAGAAPSMPVLVLGRALQGAGGGLMSVALYVLVAQAYPVALRPRIFAAFAAAWVVPVIVGPALTGLIAEHLGWRWVFLSAAGLALPAALMLRQGLRGVPPPSRATSTNDDTSPPRTSLGLALATAISAGLLYAGGHASPASAFDMILLASALIAVASLAPRLLPRGTFSGRRGLPAVVAMRGLVAASFFCAEVLIPLLLVNERGLSPVQAGLVLTVGALGWSAGSWFQGRRKPQGRARVRLLRLGMAMIFAGVITIALLLWPATPLAAAVIGWTVAGVGVGLVFPMLSVLTLECAPPEEHGAASSALQLGDALFSAVALALAGAVPAMLLPGWNEAAYAAGFGVAMGLSLLGLWLAPRAQPVAPGTA